jgi:hypothetical protein
MFHEMYSGVPSESSMNNHIDRTGHCPIANNCCHHDGVHRRDGRRKLFWNLKFENFTGK